VAKAAIELNAVKPTADTQPDPQSVFGGLSPDAFLSLGAMEGLFPALVETAPPIGPHERPADRLWPGYTLAIVAAAIAFAVHMFAIERISTLIIAILVGAAIRNVVPLPKSIAPGCKKIVKKVIPLAIVLTGAGLNLAHLAGVGTSALVVIASCVVIAIGAGFFWGKLFGLGPKTSMLIGAGTGICGNSAIIAVAPLIDAEDDDLVLSIGTVNLFGLLAMLVWPLIGGMLHMGDQVFGVWAGTTIHAVPQAIAAGQAFSPEAGVLATLVKLVRVALLAPMMVVLALCYARRHRADGTNSRMIIHYARLVPTFVWGFVLMSLLCTFGLLPTLNFELSETFPSSSKLVNVSTIDTLSKAGKILLTLAMAAIGLEVDVRMLAGVGGRALVTGLVVTATVAVSSLVLISALI